jgi:thioredoxin 1
LTEMADFPVEPVKVEDSTFDQFVQKYALTVIDCWAPWCGPCRIVGPIVDALAKEYSGKVVFGKLNTDENPAVSGRFGIMAIPTMLVVKQGRLVDQIVGAVPKAKIEAVLKKYM